MSQTSMKFGILKKRGHSSKSGAVFVISVSTGEIVDYEVKCLICYEYLARNHLKKDSMEYKAWKAMHTCHINHFASLRARRLTDKVIDCIQDYCGKGIKGNCGNLQE